MTPTLEEVKKVAIECGFSDRFVHGIDDGELQALAQHFKEEGRKEQRESDEKVCMQMDGIHDALYAEAIRNNTGD